MNYHKIFVFIFCIFVFIFSGSHLKAQTKQVPKGNLTGKLNKWEYCIIFQQRNGQVDDKKVTGFVIITYLEEAGEREEFVQAEVTRKNPKDNDAYALSIRKALVKAFAKLGSEGWEFVGKFPFTREFSFSQEDSPGFYFKRSKQ
jgi:hypothetical protein